MYKLIVRKSRVAEPEPLGYGTAITSPQPVADLARAILVDEDQEVFLAFFLDTKNKVRGYAEIARGAIAQCQVDPRVIFRAALLTPSCASLILAHNHPSGDPEPSPEDRRLTSRLVEGAKLLGLAVIDHVIVGETIYSFAEKGDDL